MTRIALDRAQQLRRHGLITAPAVGLAVSGLGYGLAYALGPDGWSGGIAMALATGILLVTMKFLVRRLLWVRYVRLSKRKLRIHDSLNHPGTAIVIPRQRIVTIERIDPPVAGLPDPRLERRWFVDVSARPEPRNQPESPARSRTGPNVRITYLGWIASRLTSDDGAEAEPTTKRTSIRTPKVVDIDVIDVDSTYPRILSWWIGGNRAAQG